MIWGPAPYSNFPRLFRATQTLYRSNCGLALPQIEPMAVNGADNIASDRSSQLALRVNRNPGGAFICAWGQPARVPLRVSLASRSYAQRFGASTNFQKRAMELSSMNEKVRVPQVCGKRERQAKTLVKIRVKQVENR
jgi:hypothetical protein